MMGCENDGGPTRVIFAYVLGVGGSESQAQIMRSRILARTREEHGGYPNRCNGGIVAQNGGCLRRCQVIEELRQIGW